MHYGKNSGSSIILLFCKTVLIKFMDLFRQQVVWQTCGGNPTRRRHVPKLLWTRQNPFIRMNSTILIVEGTTLGVLFLSFQKTLGGFRVFTMLQHTGELHFLCRKIANNMNYMPIIQGEEVQITSGVRIISVDLAYNRVSKEITDLFHVLQQRRGLVSRKPLQ